ncbi:hypothetical protein HNP55_002143 [Paucibacter oligotrophus]|uniref:Uncharacterized protein n=1 Tax=Roseateles oligotrophus TaxID=1769250 RepID=A0A840L603_9BURK|nr:hypothetical protein [Roseateles oligotrophus]MBB4843620.1 hypothetical protein [Roseateles oligotrophus]
MATPNYSYEKRQRELAKKRKTEEKRLRKANKSEGGDASGQDENQDPADAGAEPGAADTTPPSAAA